MENSQVKAAELRRKRALRVRKKLRGTAASPRLCVVKSNAHLFVQLIDDDKGITLASVATFSKEFKNTEFGRKSVDSGRVLGKKIAEIAKEKQIERVIFDRGASKYHGVVAAVAEGARENGLLL